MSLINYLGEAASVWSLQCRSPSNCGLHRNRYIKSSACSASKFRTKDTVCIQKQIICSTLFRFWQNLVQEMYKNLGKFTIMESVDATLHCVLSKFPARFGWNPTHERSTKWCWMFAAAENSCRKGRTFLRDTFMCTVNSMATYFKNALVKPCAMSRSRHANLREFLPVCLTLQSFWWLSGFHQLKGR